MLLSRNRAFTREPSRVGQAKSFYIFCEGVKREKQYFQYFREMDSRVNVEVYPLTAEEDNSPKGLLEIAKVCMLGTAETSPKYDYQKGDEVWLIFDTDPDKLATRQPQINAIRDFCRQQTTQTWLAAESNPCFEVWLYYHKQTKLINFDHQDLCKAWKAQLTALMGGFNSQKHPIYIIEAAQNAAKNFTKQNAQPNVGSTEVYLLANKLLLILKAKIELARKNMNL